jgi:hypothetical protein
MSLVLNVEILGEFRKLTAATQGATGQLQGLAGTATKISSGISNAFRTIGIGLSFGVIVNGLKDAARAAVDDAKSQKLLETALKNTTGANKDQVKGVEDSIGKMSRKAAIADDRLRPAFANLTRATKDTKKSTDLLNIALDISAGTGRNLDSVVTALSRAVGPEGTTGALERLVPAIKGAEDPMAELEKLFKGSAEQAAKLDPYARFQTAMGEVKESVGNSLLPALDKLATWFVEIQPDIQAFLDGLTGALDNPDVKKSIGNMQDSLGDLGFTIGTLFGSTETDEAKGFNNFWIVLSGIVQTIATLLGGMGAAIAAAFGNTKPMENFLDNVLDSVLGIVGAITGFRPTSPAPSPTGGRSNGPRGAGSSPSTVNININKGNVSAKEIANAVNKGAKTTGSPSIRRGAIRAQ